MKNKELREFKNKPMLELVDEVKKRRARMEELKFDLATGKVKNLKEIKDVKKSIAQIETIIQSIKNKEKS